MRPPGIETAPTDSESDVVTTPPSTYMALIPDQAQTHANDSSIFKCDTDKNKNNKNKTQRRNLNSAPSGVGVGLGHVSRTDLSGRLGWGWIT